MFSNIFSAKTVPEEQLQVIEGFYLNYKSEIFPNGIAQVSSINKIEVEKDDIVLSITVPFPCLSELNKFAEQLLAEHDISVLIDAKEQVLNIKSHDIQGVKNIIAVSSGKGGVGKSTTAVNLAYALQQEGAKVGILDADIYGPSIPKMLGLSGQKATTVNNGKMQPMEVEGIEAMSIGFLVSQEDATVWRGPMASRAFSQLLNETDWQELDYLIVDMPPGTGDIQLTLAQQVPVAAAVVITTPQDVALADAVKGLAMFKKVNVPVLGIIENMSFHVCHHCGETSHLFGADGGVKIAADFNTQLLGQLPLHAAICQNADQGVSIVQENSTSDLAILYRRIAAKMVSGLFHRFDARSPQTQEILIKQI